MGFDQPEYYDASSTVPKLSLYSLPSKRREPPEMETPPPGTLASIPFNWEEAPGKPRLTTTICSTTARSTTPLTKSKSARCLVPPPRLRISDQSTTKVTNTPSPTTVLDGPYVGPSLSLSQSKSFSFSTPEERVIRHRRRNSRERLNFTSWRWGSFKEINRRSATGGSMYFSSGHGGVDSTDTKVKITRIRRRSGSFLSFSSTSFNLLSSICESFKQAVPWRRMPQKLRKLSF